MKNYIKVTTFDGYEIEVKAAYTDDGDGFFSEAQLEGLNKMFGAMLTAFTLSDFLNDSDLRQTLSPDSIRKYDYDIATNTIDKGLKPLQK